MNFVRSKVSGGKIIFGENTIDLNPKLGGKTADYEGKEIIFGFRPESIDLNSQEQAYKITADVELTEMLGDNTNVYITTGEDKAILKVDPHDTPEIDDTIDFYIPYENVYLFDSETEFRIAC